MSTDHEQWEARQDCLYVIMTSPREFPSHSLHRNFVISGSERGFCFLFRFAAGNISISIVLLYSTCFKAIDCTSKSTLLHKAQEQNSPADVIICGWVSAASAASNGVDISPKRCLGAMLGFSLRCFNFGACSSISKLQTHFDWKPKDRWRRAVATPTRHLATSRPLESAEFQLP